ncbi:MAG: adenosyl-hopene transferase HpnH [Verrucomicrobiota bacterium]|nr:adenosyl-hopene transferase HpnH [Verrucomicrobiota bacterium]
MAVPISQMYTVASYVLGKKLSKTKRYPLVLMLEPLFKCNLACAGCGKIQYPEHIIQRRLTPEQCFAAVEECGAPMVSIPGGEPLLHPEIKQIVEGLVKRKKYIYLCTNAILLKSKIDLFTPSKYLTFSVHLDGLKDEHDHAVCRDGIFDVAVKGIKEALKRGFRVTTNTTLFDDANPERVREFFDFLTGLGIEGMMISPGYGYQKAPDQEHFLQRNRTTDLFKKILHQPKREWKFNLSPLFLRFLQGEKDYECTPWGMPAYNIFGWQKPCYLLGEGYASSFKELIETTEWDKYGNKSGNEKCTDCMVHCGFEATAVNDTFGSIRGFMDTVKFTINPSLV